MKKLLKILLYTLCGVVLFLALLAGVTQTQFFRDRLRSAALSNLQALLDADISLGELHGNLVTGFSIDSIAVRVQGSDVVRAERVDLRYSLLEIPGRTISIRGVSIIHPVINLVRPVGEQWNIIRMLKPIPPDTIPSRPFDWVLQIDRLEIQGGVLSLVDSASLADPEHVQGDSSEVEYHDISLKEINLILAAELRGKEKHLAISSMSFVSERPGFRLKKLAGDFTVSPSEARVKALTIVTDHSEIRLDADMKRFDLFGGLALPALERCPVNLSLQAQEINFEEMKKFLPELCFLHGPVSLNLAATGEFGDLLVNKLDVRFGHSEVRMKGSVQELHDPRNLYLDVQLLESKIDPADPLVLMPTFNLPDLNGMGTLRMAMHFQGRPTDFRTKGNVETDGGGFESDMSLAIGGLTTLHYQGTVNFRNLDLAKLFDDESLNSRLTGGMRIDGEGVTLGALNSNMLLDLDSSMFRGQPLRDTHVNISGSDGALQGKAYIRLGSMSSTLGLGIKQDKSGPPAFQIEGDVRTLHVGSFLMDPDNDHITTFRFRAKGSGSSLQTVGGQLDLDYSYWQESDSTSTPGTLHLDIDQTDPSNRDVHLESTMGSLTLSGQFDLGSLGSVVGAHARMASNAVRDRFAFFDSSASGAPKSVSISFGTGAPVSPERIDMKFAAHVEDLDLLTVFFPAWEGFGQAECSGTIAGSSEEMSLRGHLAIDQFAYGRVEGGTLIEGGALEFDVLHARSAASSDSMAAEIRGSFRSLHINQYGLDNVETEFSYSADSATYLFGSVLNGNVTLRSRGTAGVTGDTITVRVDSLRCAYKDYDWDALSGTEVKIGRHEVSISNLVLHRGVQEVHLSATLGSAGALSGLIVANRLDLDALKYLLNNEESKSAEGTFTGQGDVRLDFSGTLDEPQFDASLTADRLAYRTVAFGLLRGAFTYRNRTLQLQVSIDSQERHGRTAPELSIAGTIPVDLGLRNVQDRTADTPMNLTVRSDSLEIGLLDPLLPTFDQLRGIMTGDVTVGGTPKRPHYDGTIRIKDCSFLFVPNNITYLFDGTFRPEGERIKVVDAVVKNIPSDEAAGQQGEMHIGGDLLLSDFKPGDFNLTASGQLLVVKEATGTSALSVYGRLFVEIGPGGLHFTGSMAQSLLKGDLLVRNSSLIFPPTRTLRQQEAELSVPIITVDDTSKAAEASRTAAARYFGTAGERLQSATLQSLLPTKSFIDGVRYDLDIETAGGNTEIRMIFNPGEELNATIDGKFSVTEDGQKWFGDLTIESATYNYLKRFNASGKISFTGDFANPGLDISATYEGTRKIRDTTSAMETTEPVVVTIRITGTRFVPKLAISMKIADFDYANYPDSRKISGDVQSDAIQFILSGSFPLTTSQKNDVASTMPSTMGTSLLTGASSMLTGAISDFLRTQTGFISSVELSYGTGDNVGQRTDIRLSGSAFNGLWRYGGKILSDPLSNANFSLLYSFGTLFSDPALRNLMFELERRVQDVTIGQTNISRGINSARLFYRFSF